MKIDPQIKSELKKMYNQIRENGGVVEIKAPYKLSESEIKEMQKTFDFMKGADIVVVEDKSLLAGFIITFGSKMIDLSLKNELQNLKLHLYESI